MILLKQAVHMVDDLQQHVQAGTIQMQAQLWQMIEAVLIRFRPPKSGIRF